MAQTPKTFVPVPEHGTLVLRVASVDYSIEQRVLVNNLVGTATVKPGTPVSVPASQTGQVDIVGKANIATANGVYIRPLEIAPNVAQPYNQDLVIPPGQTNNGIVLVRMGDVERGYLPKTGDNDCTGAGPFITGEITSMLAGLAGKLIFPINESTRQLDYQTK